MTLLGLHTADPPQLATPPPQKKKIVTESHQIYVQKQRSMSSFKRVGRLSASVADNDITVQMFMRVFSENMEQSLALILFWGNGGKPIRVKSVL